MIFERLRERGFQVLALHHAEAVLIHDMPDAITELETALLSIELPLTELVRGGGGEGRLTQRLRRVLANDFGWNKHVFEVKRVIDGEEKECTTHEIDHVKRFDNGTVALEIEWNNKDPFFDRDLENFKRLHADGAVSIGGIITRGRGLQNALEGAVHQFAIANDVKDIESLSAYYRPTLRQQEMIKTAASRFGSFGAGWAHAFVGDKFGRATTHWEKLEERVRRGVGNPCPLLLFGISEQVLTLNGETLT